MIVITMVFRERPRHGVAASNSATRRHSQRMKSGQPESFDHFSAITHLLMSLSQRCCLRSHHSLMPPVPHRQNGMCAATTRRRAVSRCAPWPVVDSGPLGPAASSMSPTRFTVLGVKVSASPRRVHRWRTSACPRSSLGCLLPSLPSQSKPCCPPHSHNHAPFPVTVTTMLPRPQSQPHLDPPQEDPSPLTPHPSRLIPYASALSPHPSPLSSHPSHPHCKGTDGTP